MAAELDGLSRGVLLHPDVMTRDEGLRRLALNRVEGNRLAHQVRRTNERLRVAGGTYHSFQSRE